MLKILNVSLSLALAGILAACASSSPDVIQRGDTQRLAQVQDGVVLSVRTVVVDGSQTGIGATVGGVVGAVGGFAGSGVQREAQVLGVLAGVAGAAAGNAREELRQRDEEDQLLPAMRLSGSVPAKTQWKSWYNSKAVIAVPSCKPRVVRCWRRGMPLFW